MRVRPGVRYGGGSSHADGEMPYPRDIRQRGAQMTAEPVPFKVADLSLARFGRNEIRLAQHEMPGLLALREEYAGSRPLANARGTGALHMTVQTAVLIETPVALGAEARWA